MPALFYGGKDVQNQKLACNSNNGGHRLERRHGGHRLERRHGGADAEKKPKSYIGRFLV